MARIPTAILSTLLLLTATSCHRSIYNVPPTHTAFVADPGRLHLRGNVGMNGIGGELAYGIDSAWHLTTAVQWVGSELTDSNYLSSTYLDLSVARNWRLSPTLVVSTMLTVGHGWTRCPPGPGFEFNKFTGSGIGVDSGAYVRLALQQAISYVWGEATIPDSSGDGNGLFTISAIVRVSGVRAFDMRDGGAAVSDGQVLLCEPTAAVSWGSNRYGFLIEFGTSLAAGDTWLREWPGYGLVGFYSRF